MIESLYLRDMLELRNRGIKIDELQTRISAVVEYCEAELSKCDSYPAHYCSKYLIEIPEMLGGK